MCVREKAKERERKIGAGEREREKERRCDVQLKYHERVSHAGTSLVFSLRYILDIQFASFEIWGGFD